jgi:hypothetical protein
VLYTLALYRPRWNRTQRTKTQQDSSCFYCCLVRRLTLTDSLPYSLWLNPLWLAKRSLPLFHSIGAYSCWIEPLHVLQSIAQRPVSFPSYSKPDHHSFSWLCVKQRLNRIPIIFCFSKNGRVVNENKNNRERDREKAEKYMQNGDGLIPLSRGSPPPCELKSFSYCNYIF